MNRVLVATALTAGIALLGAQAAQANVINQNFTFATLAGAGTESGPTLNNFNSALGTLTSVKISESVTATWSGGTSSDLNQAFYLVFVGDEVLSLIPPLSLGDGSGSDSESLTVTASADLAKFISGTQFTSVFVTKSASGTASLSSTFGTGTLTYNYTPTAVPEPGSLALLATGVLGLALLRRRRRG